MKFEFKSLYNFTRIRLNGVIDVWVVYKDGGDISRVFPPETGIIKKEYFDDWSLGSLVYEEMVEQLKKFMVKEML